LARLTVDPEGGLLELLLGPADQLQGVGSSCVVISAPGGTSAFSGSLTFSVNAPDDTSAPLETTELTIST
jgi:hypothetical protein